MDVIGQLFNDNGNIKPRKNITIEFHLKDTHKIYWLEIIDALPKTWKDYHTVRKSQICSLDKLFSKELYLILVDANAFKPTAQDYFEMLFATSQVNWKKYFLICNTNVDTKTHMFWYKVLQNILYANKMLFKFGKVTSPRCSFCKLHDETIIHVFMTA